MVENFMAIKKKCDQCGEDYLPAHQNDECPHERLVDLIMAKSKKESSSLIRERVLQVFDEYSGWWDTARMAKWLDVSVEEVTQVYDELEAEGLMDRKKDRVLKP